MHRISILNNETDISEIDLNSREKIKSLSFNKTFDKD